MTRRQYKPDTASTMGILIYGPDRPKFGHEQSPDGSLTVQIENENTYSFDHLPYTVCWHDLYADTQSKVLPSQSDYRSDKMTEEDIEESEREQFLSFIEHLIGMVETQTEEKFLRTYAKGCIGEGAYQGYKRGEFGLPAWSHPALIPQVWVNWYHFDPKDPERAQLAQEEPFRVDFMFKDGESGLGDDLAVIEIDGASHFGDTEIGPDGELVIETSMDAYTTHLKKDRWLRKKGWDVVRVSSQEVKELDGTLDFFTFFNEIMDRDVIVGELPF